MTKSLDLAKLLPKRYRDKTIDALIGNLFNQHLSKPDVESFYGYIGSTAEATASDIYLEESNIERQANQLEPALYTKAATDEDVTTWADLVQRMNLLGISYSNLADWLTIGTHNFVPPIDIDKFTNFGEYMWIGGWLLEDDTLPYEDLGIDDLLQRQAVMSVSNPDYLPDYYVMASGIGTDWSYANLWVHKEDALAFFNLHGATLTLAATETAKRPIIELDGSVQLNEFVTPTGLPCDGNDPSAISRPQAKQRRNQPPQLDLYYHTGEHAGLTSAGFYYQESPAADVDEVLGRRIVLNGENYMFAHGFTHPANGRLLWYRSNGDLRNMWVRTGDGVEGSETAHKTAEYMKYSTIGTVLNLDKLLNYQDYFWVNHTTDPEYNCIAAGTSDWALENAWAHVAQLTHEERLASVPAERPIIEFNAQLDAELINTTKSERHELPRFKVYRRTGPETLAYPSSFGDLPVNDAYTNGVLFARLADIDPDLQAAIMASPELQARLLVKVKGEQYVQSLANGVYRAERDAITYGFNLRTLVRSAQGDGQVLVTSIDPVTTVPRLLKLTALSATTFQVTDYKGTSYTPLTVDSSYTIDGVDFTLLSGAQPFAVGDKLVLEVRSVVYDRIELYCRLDTEFKTFSTPDGFLTDAVIRKLVPADISARNGAWLAIDALQQNLDSENGLVFDQADLVTHFASIIAAQPDMEGNAFGRNNWRQLSPRFYALGGLIKQVDERLALFLSTLVQPGVTPVTLLETSKLAYDEMLSRVREYVEERIVDDMVAGNATVAGGGKHVDAATVAKLIAYLEGDAFTGDLGVGRPFHDTTMPIKALTLTLPYLGIIAATAPEVYFDLQQGIQSIRHHDGHSSPYPVVTDEVVKRLVTKLFKRSSGQVTPGVVTGPTPPQKPFAKQLWLDLSQMNLYVFDVISDEHAMPTDVPYGSVTYDRETGEVSEFNGAWVSLGDSQTTQDSQWRQVNLSETLAELLIEVETKLYNGAPAGTLFNFTGDSNTYDGLMAKEFSAFAAKHGIANPYSGGYDADNPFTWNYQGSSIVTPGAETWQNVYFAEYNTYRPDLEPWAALFMTESDWLADMVANGYLAPGTTTFSVSMWPDVAVAHSTLLSSAGVPQSNPGALGVVAATGQLLPPYAFGVGDSLFTALPATPAADFALGTEGPIELMWTRTTDYLLAQARSMYRVQPLTMTEQLWGDDFVRVNGYGLLESTGNKPRIQDVQIHGQHSVIEQSPFVLSAIVSGLPSQPLTLAVRVVRADLLSVTNGGTITLQPGETATMQLLGYGPDALTVDLTLNRPKEGLRVGSIATVTFDDLGGATITTSVPEHTTSSGFGQVLMHSLRRESIDVALTQALSRLTAWEPRMAYRFGSLIDTASLLVNYNDEEVTKSSIRVLLDEVRHQSSAWYSALKVTLHRKGAAERVGQLMIPALSSVTNRRGDDWVYRVDVMNQAGPGIQWYTMTDAGNTFMALGGRNTTDEWHLPQVKGALQTGKGPFLVTGIQNLVNFLQGYSTRQHELGFRAGGTDEPVIDAEIGRKIDWQLLIEQTVDKQFTGVSEGAMSVLNPFKDELAFVSPRGVVTSFADPISDESLTPMLLDAAGKRLPTGSYRVFRQGELTTANFDQQVYGVHVMTSVYEHVLLLPYTDGAKLLFSPLLGQHAARLFLLGERQATKHGRLEFGGKFLRGNEMTENMEASVRALGSLYDTASLTADTVRAERIRAMLGFHEQDYFDQRGTSAASEFRFFQGLLRAKGTNAAVSAYLNSRRFKSAYLDEFWAYRIASYGDGRPVIDVDMKVGMEDFTGDYANYLFLEEDELDHLDDWAQQMGYDVPNYDVTPYDGYSIYGPEQVHFVEYFDPNGAIIIRPDNPDRWYRYTDQNQLRYFEADSFVDIRVYVDELHKPIRLKDKFGNLVRSDTFEVLVTIEGYAAGGYDMQPYDSSETNLDYLLAIHREPGDYIEGTEPPEYSTPVFKRLNHSTIVFESTALLNRNVIVRCYAPGLGKFTPAKLYRYKPEVTAASDDIIWWDPARGFHHPEAFAHVDYVLKRDPAIYNESLLRGEGTQVNARRPWGPAEVGKVWWDMSKTAWLPYSDTKLNPNLQDRLAQWGGVAEHADLKLYEWVEAAVPPSEYCTLVEAGTASGEVGMGRYLYRDRTWQQRPVAWLYSDNPQQIARKALGYQTDTLNEVIYGDKTYIVPTQGTMPSVLASGIKIAGAQYAEGTRQPSELLKPLGQLLVTSDEVEFIIGSTTSFTAPSYSYAESFNDVHVVAIPGTLAAIKTARGRLILSNEVVGLEYFVRATFETTGMTQRVLVTETPVMANVPYELVFDNLGVKIACRSKYGHDDQWPVYSSLTVASQRAQRVALELGSTAHNIVIREALPIQVQVPTGLASLPGSSASGSIGWMAWADPVNISTDNVAPLNKYEPLFGDWVDVGTRLAPLAEDIKARLRSPWTLRNATTVEAYKTTWTRWKLYKNTVSEAMYTRVGQTHDQALRLLGFLELPATVLFDQAEAFVNGRKVPAVPTVDGINSYMLINQGLLREGDSVRIVIPSYQPTAAELATDLSLVTADPSSTREFKLDVPYVKLEERNGQGKVVQARYFYWVTGKTEQALNKRMSTLLAQNLLRNHDGGYAVPQVFKSFNQVDGRPNRYAMLCVRGISHLVGAEDTFRLRLTRDPGMRTDSEDNHLKVRHNEWVLIRPGQVTRIPKELWDKLVDTICAETALGQALPYVQLYEHDATSDVKAAYGLGEGQVLTDQAEAKATLLGTMLNTRVERYDEDVDGFVPDPISYAGFDLATVEARLATAASARALLGELWLNAKPKQLNELFFAVLEDCLARNIELADIFKTSYIGLGEVRTLADPLLTTANTMFGTV